MVITFTIDDCYARMFASMTEEQRSAWIESAIRIKTHIDSGEE